MTPATAFLERLRQATESAAAAEIVCRREANARIAILEQERAFAFRRSNLTRAIAEAVLWRPGKLTNRPRSRKRLLSRARLACCGRRSDGRRTVRADRSC